MAEITQKLGFDVSQGVQALNQLNTAVLTLTTSLNGLSAANLSGVSQKIDGVRKSLGETANTGTAATKTIKGFAGGLSATEAQLGAANSQLKVLDNNFQLLDKGAKQAGGSIRSAAAGFILFRAATSGLRAVKDLLLEAADASREFQQSVAEVQTIAGGATFSTLTSEIRALSVEFGKPTVEQAEAAYQAYSNQIVQTTADLGFLNTANTLAIATVASTADAVGVLSSVMNSYGESAGTAAEISDILFKTVEEGRLRLSDIANSLGTVTPLADAAGVSFVEVAASIATITKRGTTASVAMTQLRGIIQKVLKPTELMKEAFAEFGATDGPSAIKAAGGFNEFLVKMTEFAEKNGTTVQQMFGRIRAGAGVLNLAKNNGEDFAETLVKIEGGAGSAAEAMEIINQTDARKAEIAFNKLKVTIEELGDAVVPVITTIVEGISSVVPRAEVLGVVLGGIAASLLVVAAGAAAMVLSFLPLAGIAAALAPFALVLAGIVAVTGSVAFALNSVNKEFEDLKTARLADVESALKSSEEILRIEKEKGDRLKKAAEDVTKQVVEENGEQLAAARKLSADLIAEFQTSATSFIDLRVAAAKEIGKLSKTAAKISEDAGDRIQKSNNKLDDLKFDKSIKGFDNINKAVRQLSRAQETAAKSREQLANAGLDQDKIKAALDTRRLAEEQFAAAEKSAGLSKNSTLERKISEAQEGFIEKNLTADKKSQTESGKLRADQAADAKKKLDEQTNELRIKLKELEELGNPFDAANFPKTVEQVAADIVEMKKVAQEFADILKEDATGGLADRAGIDTGAATDLAVEATGKLLFGTKELRDGVQNIVDSAPFQAKLQFEEAAKAQTVEIDTSSAQVQVNQLGVALGKQVNEIGEILTRGTGILGLGDAFTTMKDKAIDAGFALSGIEKKAIGSDSAARTLGLSISAALEDIGNFDVSQIDVAKQKLDDLKTTSKESLDAGDISQTTFDRTAEAIKASENALKLREEQVKAQINLLEGVGTNTETSLNNTNTAAGNLGTSMGTAAGSAVAVDNATVSLAPQIQAAVGPANALAVALERGARARAQATGGGGGAAGTAFFGKRIHRQTGGFTRGQDRILTSTAPGEFVMNASSTRRFRSELTAMNSNQAPQFRESGGAVTNIGDINVNVQTQDASDISGRNIARELNRELRTRGSKLF